jgi:leucyl/phenylalanyl-tRNA---protein transferase
MAEEDGTIYWYDPDPRTIMPLDGFHASRSLQRTIRRGIFEVRFNTSFQEVMRACAEPAPQRETTWINDEFIEVYTLLHRAGYAHSVETWRDGQLVGGVYGVQIQGLFAGESMFSRKTDASKVALAYLVERLQTRGFVVFDVQFTTDHLRRLGAVEMSRDAYKSLLINALNADATFV